MALSSASRRAVRPGSKFAVLLADSLHDLSELHRYARQIRIHQEIFAEADFSPQELDALISTVQAGYRSVARLCVELGCGGRAGAGEVIPSPALEEAQAPTRLILDYKRCSRHLDLALQQTREAHDPRSGETLYLLLRNLEKQLWLLNAPPASPFPGGALLGLAQAG